MDSESSDIVITGLAAISAAGVGVAPLREAIRKGTSFLQPVPEEVLGEQGYLWGKADGFRATDFMSPLKARRFDRCSLFAVVAVGMALEDAGVDLAATDRRRVGIALGCGFGGIANSEEFLRGYFTAGVGGLAPLLFPNTVANAAASNASIDHGLKGPNVTIVQRFCSAESAFMMARRFLEEDRADIVIAGGVDEVNPLLMRGFKSIGQLTRFGRGFGEGTGVLLLEKRGHAVGRGARILAGVGSVGTVGRLIPGFEAEGAGRLCAGCDKVDLVSLSGTVTEVQAVMDCLPAAPRLDTGLLFGRSLAMGGIAMVSHVISLAGGDRGLLLAASPEGPYYAITIFGGAPVQS